MLITGIVTIAYILYITCRWLRMFLECRTVTNVVCCFFDLDLVLVWRVVFVCILLSAVCLIDNGTVLLTYLIGSCLMWCDTSSQMYSDLSRVLRLRVCICVYVYVWRSYNDVTECVLSLKLWRHGCVQEACHRQMMARLALCYRDLLVNWNMLITIMLCAMYQLLIVLLGITINAANNCGVPKL